MDKSELHNLQETRRHYRATFFDTLSGKTVLADLLVRSTLITPGSFDPVLAEQGKEILYKLGVFHDLNVDRLVDALASCANDDDIREQLREAEEGSEQPNP